MHELSLTENLLDVTLENAGPRKVIHVNLLIGEFSHEREEAIQFYWNDLAKGTSAEDAQLILKHVDAEMQCLVCGKTFHPDDEAAFCPNCRSHRLTLLSGDDVKLESIDVE